MGQDISLEASQRIVPWTITIRGEQNGISPLSHRLAGFDLRLPGAATEPGTVVVFLRMAMSERGLLSASHQRLSGNATSVDAGASKELALDDRYPTAGLRKPCAESRPGLTGADDD
jgi:hypothetical protein